MSIITSGVKTFDLRIDNTSVPDAETTYYCQSFILPHDEEYHIIADEVLMGNDKVLHHMILRGCLDPGKLLQINSSIFSIRTEKCYPVLWPAASPLNHTSGYALLLAILVIFGKLTKLIGNLG